MGRKGTPVKNEKENDRIITQLVLYMKIGKNLCNEWPIEPIGRPNQDDDDDDDDDDVVVVLLCVCVCVCVCLIQLTAFARTFPISNVALCCLTFLFFHVWSQHNIHSDRME